MGYNSACYNNDTYRYACSCNAITIQINSHDQLTMVDLYRTFVWSFGIKRVFQIV